MSGYPHNNQPGYGYGGSPEQPYGAPQQPGAPHPYGGQPPYAPHQPGAPHPYGGQPPYAPHQPGASHPYGGQPPYGAPSAPHKPDKPPKDDYSQSYYGGSAPGKPDKPPKDGYSQSYYGGSAPGKPDKPPKDGYSQSYYGGSAPGKPDKPPKDGYSQSYYGGSAPEKPNKPPKEDYSHSHYGGSAPPMAQPYGAAPPYGSPFASLVPSAFPAGTDPSVIACFQVADQDGSGLIDDKELQRALSSFNQSFSLRTVHLLMYLFTNTNSRKIGPKEFISLFYSLQNWRSIFDRYDRDRSGKIDAPELREALLSLGYAVSPTVLELLMLKFDKTGGKSKAIEYDNFIECCLTVKGLTDKFKAKDTNYSGSATFSYEEFMLTILPFLVA